MEDDAKSISIDGHLYYIKWLEMAGWLVGPRFLISKCGKNNGKNSGAARRHGSSGKPPPTTPVSISTAFETVPNRISQPCADPPSPWMATAGTSSLARATTTSSARRQSDWRRKTTIVTSRNTGSGYRPGADAHLLLQAPTPAPSFSTSSSSTVLLRTKVIAYPVLIYLTCSSPPCFSKKKSCVNFFLIPSVILP
jgi:hypothetical protein